MPEGHWSAEAVVPGKAGGGSPALPRGGRGWGMFSGWNHSHQTAHVQPHGAAAGGNFAFARKQELKGIFRDLPWLMLPE